MPAEFSPLPHSRETLGAARGSNINSATSQFYINVANNNNLNGNSISTQANNNANANVNSNNANVVNVMPPGKRKRRSAEKAS